MQENRLKELLNQYFNNNISREDCEELLMFLDSREGDKAISKLVDVYIDKDLPTMPIDKLQSEEIFKLINNEITKQPKKPKSVLKIVYLLQHQWFKVAAVLTISVSIAFWFYTRTAEKSANGGDQLTFKTDIILPRENSAILMLADGRKVIVNDSLIYDDNLYDFPQVTDIAYHSLSTPKGQSFQLTLPDGSKVWLNTGSTIRFPAQFDAAKRSVEIVGEAYFEVAHKPSHPFEVNANGSMIEVLGTHFNVSAYDDDNLVTTTLVEGAVNVTKNGNTLGLMPGEQALINSETGVINRKKADIHAVMAWKSGQFRFDNLPIEKILENISRWYDIKDVVYQGHNDDRFTGTFKRSKNLSELLAHFEKISSMRFKIEEGRVVIME